MRVVLDTNVVVSALLFPRGSLSWLPALWATGRITPLICDRTTREVVRVLAYPKFRLSPDDIHAVLGGYLPYAEVVPVSSTSLETVPVCRDPHDQMFVELASAGGAEVLVTGDADLQALAGQLPFTVEAPEAFRRRLLSA